MSQFKKTKFYQLLKSFKKKEFNQFELYLSSPFFLKKNENILKLYLATKKHWAELTNNELSKEFFFMEVFPGAKYDDLKMRHLLNKAVRIVDNYLLHLYHEQNEMEREVRITAIYNKRNIYPEFVKNTRRILKNLDKEQIKDTNFHYIKYILERNYICHPKINKNKEKNYFNKAFKSFHNFIALEHLNLQLEVNNNKRIFSGAFLQPELKYANELTIDNISLEILVLANKILIEGTENEVLKLRALLEENLSVLSDSEKINAFFVILNFSMQAMTNNPKWYTSFIFQVYKMGLEHGLILINGEILGSSYLNIVKVGIANKDLEWTTKFIENYEQKIPIKNRSLIQKISLSYIYFAKNKFEEVINILSQDKVPEVKLSINIRTIILRSKFKLFLKDPTYHGPLMKYFDSFEKFLDREKELISIKKTRNKRFSRFLRKITSLLHRGKWNKRRKLDLIKELENKKDIGMALWLKSVIEEIK